MSDSSMSIVPKISRFPEKEQKAKEILDWLVSLDIVKRELSDCVMSEYFGHTFSDGAKNVLTDPQFLSRSDKVNGLEINLERGIHHGNVIDEMICPNCGKDISDEDWDFFNEWAKGVTDNLHCPLCHVSNEIHKYKMEPEWGFSDLAFIFWNWPPEFKDEFLEEFRNRLGFEIAVVYNHI